MIALKEKIPHHEIFSAIRSAVQELHPDRILMEEAYGAPFLLKSQDAHIWIRVFYHSMQEDSLEAVRHEIKKLWVLMPREAQLYLFFPALDHLSLLKMNSFGERVSFFEYGYSHASGKDSIEVRIRKWIPSMSFSSMPVEEGSLALRQSSPVSSFLQRTRLMPREIADLVELGLALRRL